MFSGLNPPHDVMHKMFQERSFLIELGPDMFYEDIMSIPLEQRLDPEWLVSKHLQLNRCNAAQLGRPEEQQQGKSERKLSSQRKIWPGTNDGQESSPTRDELMDMCMSDLLQRDIDWSAGPPTDPCWTRHERSTVGESTIQ